LPAPVLKPKPRELQGRITAYFHGSLSDPTKIREAAISDPVLKPVNEIRGGQSETAAPTNAAKGCIAWAVVATSETS
jgi:hypothetical protein